MSRYETFLSIDTSTIENLINKGMSNTKLISFLLDDNAARDPRIRRRVTTIRSQLGNSVQQIRNNHDVDKVRELVKQSLCMTDILKGLGLSSHGNNHKTIKQIIVNNQLDISHFNLAQALRRGKKYWTYEEIFVKQSKISRPSLSKYVERYKVLPYSCVECNNGGYWKDKKLRLVVDHIDGVSDNNEVNNLRYLCPNCHSQTDTFAGKNKNKSKSKK